MSLGRCVSVEAALLCALALPVSMALSLSACGAGPTSTNQPLREPDQYEGCASDEHWRLFDGYEIAGAVKVDDADAPAMVAPVPGAALGAKPSFVWNKSATDAGAMYGTATCAQCDYCGRLGGMHFPPISGDDYDLQISVGGTIVWRVITSQQTWTPRDDMWSRIKADTASPGSPQPPLQLQIVRANLADNTVDAGPYRSSRPLNFTVSP